MPESPAPTASEVPVRAVTVTVTMTVGALLLAGCQSVSGPVVSEQRDADGVTAVDLRTSGDLTVVVGGSPSLTVSAAASVLPSLTSDVDDGVLVLGATRGGWVGAARIEYVLTVPDAATLEALTVRGSGGLDAADLAPSRLSVSLEGSGDVRLAGLEVDELQVDLDGSGTVRVAGSAREQQVTLSGSGGYDGAGLTSRDALVALEGSGDARVDVTGTLDATVAGSGTVSHTGGAAVDSAVSGSGDVVAR